MEPDDDFLLLDRKPDTSEKVIRAVCGFIAGLLLAANIGLRCGDLSLKELELLFAVTSVVCSYLAARFGDPFWERLLRLRQ